MKKYGYKRPSATLMVKKRPARRKKPSFFFTFLFVLILLALLGAGAFVCGRYVYYAFKSAQVADWHVKSVAVAGLSGTREKEIFNRLHTLEGNPFSAADADRLRSELADKYPMLAEVSVSRGLLSGTLKVTARPRRPIARFMLADNSQKYIDEKSVVYADDQEVDDVLPVTLVGAVPNQLPPSFAELVQSLLKLKKSLPFESLEFNVTDNAVTLRLPDQSVIHFGPATHLKQKVGRAAQVMTFARGRYNFPVTLNFAFFEKGKVFLTQTAH